MDDLIGLVILAGLLASVATVSIAPLVVVAAILALGALVG